MPLRTVFLIVVLALIALFAVLNWGAFLAPTTLSFGVAQVQAPLGLIMLGYILWGERVPEIRRHFAGMRRDWSRDWGGCGPRGHARAIAPRAVGRR